MTRQRWRQSEIKAQRKEPRKRHLHSIFETISFMSIRWVIDLTYIEGKSFY